VLVQSGPPTGAGNVARLEVDHVTIGGATPAMNMQLLGAGTSVDLFFDHNRYEGDSPGAFAVTLRGDSQLRVHDTAPRLETRNHHFDITNILGFLIDRGPGRRHFSIRPTGSDWNPGER
jgi:hypothetical protein